MSLFDVIRYTNTNLGSTEELSKLPAEFFKLYWTKSIYGYVDSWQIEHDKDIQIQWLVIWYNSEGYRTEQISRFKAVLKEYNNEPI